MSADDRKRAGEVHGEARVRSALRDVARRRPGAYLLGCAAVGFVATIVLLNAVSAAWSMTSRTSRGVALER